MPPAGDQVHKGQHKMDEAMHVMKGAMADTVGEAMSHLPVSHRSLHLGSLGLESAADCKTSLVCLCVPWLTLQVKPPCTRKSIPCCTLSLVLLAGCLCRLL